MAEQNPLAKYELRRIGGSPRNTEGRFTNENGNAARDARRAARREARPMTYAEMQQAGIARPAPPTPTQNVASMFMGEDAQVFDAGSLPKESDLPNYGTIPEGFQGYNPLGVSTSGQAPSTGAPSMPPAGMPPMPSMPFGPQSPYDDRIYRSQRDSALANLEAQFASNRRALEEDMARRGLSASSVGADRLADLFGQQERTRASLEAQLLADEDERRRAWMDYYLRMLPVVAAGKGGK